MNRIIVFVDGSCLKQNTGRAQDRRTGYGINFPNGELMNVSEKFTIGEGTNNRAELFSIHEALRLIHQSNLIYDRIDIYSDSEYSINIFIKYLREWKNNNWRKKNKKPILNLDLIKPIDILLKRIKNNRKKIIFHHVYAHTNGTDFKSINNAIADRLAKAGANK